MLSLEKVLNKCFWTKNDSLESKTLTTYTLPRCKPSPSHTLSRHVKKKPSEARVTRAQQEREQEKTQMPESGRSSHIKLIGGLTKELQKMDLPNKAVLGLFVLVCACNCRDSNAKQ